MKTTLLLISILGGLTWTPGRAQLPAYSRSLSLMGADFVLTAVHDDSLLARNAVYQGIAEIQRIEALISSWDARSQTSLINRYAGYAPVRVDWELYALIQRACKVSALTRGAFDISTAAMDRVWTFDGSEQAFPHPGTLHHSANMIDYQKILLYPEDTSVYLVEKGMKIGFGGIGKGYAAGRAKALMQAMGIRSGIVNAGGDLIAWGKNPVGRPWRIGIADPAEPEQFFGYLHIHDQAVVTSGDYARFALIDGKRYAHIIDPQTGHPIQGMRSVTVICPDPELADALATAVFVMGKRQGLELINALKGVECLIVSETGPLIRSDGLVLRRE